MHSNQAKRNQPLHKAGFNELQKYLLNKSKYHQIYVMRHISHPSRKHIDRSADQFLGEKPTIKKVRHIQYRPQITDVPQPGLSLEKHSSHNANNQDPQKYKKWKSNKTLLSLLLNNFHHEQYINEMFIDIDASLRHDKTSHTFSLHKQPKKDNHHKSIKEENKGHMEALPKITSLYFNHAQKPNKYKVISKETKCVFNQSFPEVDTNKQTKKSNKAAKSILKQSDINNSLSLNPDGSQNLLHRARHHRLDRKRKQNKCQRSSQKYYKACSRYKENTDQNLLSKLDPWSTTMINEQITDL